MYDTQNFPGSLLYSSLTAKGVKKKGEWEKQNVEFADILSSQLYLSFFPILERWSKTVTSRLPDSGVGKMYVNPPFNLRCQLCLGNTRQEGNTDCALVKLILKWNIGQETELTLGKKLSKVHRLFKSRWRLIFLEVFLKTKPSPQPIKQKPQESFQP